MASITELLETIGERLGAIPAVEKVEGLIESLSPRDRKLLTGLVLFFTIGLFAGAVYLIDGAISRQEILISQRTNQLMQAQDTLMDLQEVRSRVESVEERLREQEGFIVQSFVEKQVLAAGIGQDKLQNIDQRSEIPGDRYKQVVVEVQLKDISLNSLVRLLHQIEYGETPIHVKSLRTRVGRRDRNELDVDMELLVVSLQEES